MKSTDGELTSKSACSQSRSSSAYSKSISYTSGVTTSSCSDLTSSHISALHESQSRLKPSRYHRWTSNVPCIILAFTLLFFISIVGFFAFHAVFTPPRTHLGSRVKSATHHSVSGSGTKGHPAAKDLEKLLRTEVSHDEHRKIVQTDYGVDLEDRNLRRIRQNSAADYAPEVGGDYEDGDEDVPFASAARQNNVSVLRAPHCHIPDLSLVGDHRNDGRNRMKYQCREHPDKIYGIGAAHDCCYQVITHLKKQVEPDSWQSLVCTPFDPQDEGSDVLLQRFDFVRIICKVKEKGSMKTREEFRSNIPLEPPHVRKKIQYWIDHSSQGPLPPNVLILGLDSVSRRRSYNSFPLSRSLLTKYGFSDMKGFHVVGPKTLDNILPLVMGIAKADLIEVCGHRWQSYWDSCPFIWKEFNEANYVTLYAEDIPDTFNYGNQLGFETQPTDYYFRPLLLEKAKYDGDPYCFGNRTTSEVLLEYVGEFVEKFRQFSTPFFAFSWLNLQRLTDDQMDKILSDFFVKIKLQQLTKNTLVLILSDHGLQTGPLRQGLEGYLDHRLPMLFVRLPNLFSQFESALEKNSLELISPFDIYQTLKDVLLLKNTNFSTDSSDGNGIRGLLKVKENRTCTEAGVDIQWCTCNAQVTQGKPNPSLWLTRFVKQEKLVAIAMKKLNEMVQLQKEALMLPSTHSDLCPELFFESISYVGTIGSNMNESMVSQDVNSIVLGIQVVPQYAQFEVFLQMKQGRWQALPPILRTDTNKGYIFCLKANKKIIHS